MALQTNIRGVGTAAKGFFGEFKDFAIKGNAFELAIAVVVGNAFSAVVNSLVADVITPFLGFVTGNGTTDVKNLTLTLRPVLPLTPDQQPLLIHYGAFLQTLINFFLITLSIFVVFKALSSARKRLFVETPKEPTKPAQERLLEEIRDLLRAQK